MLKPETLIHIEGEKRLKSAQLSFASKYFIIKRK